ncbi:hypothetical protein D3C81_2106480 [compost metagenome]
MDFHAGQVFFVTFESGFYGSAYPLLKTDAALNMVVAIDLDLHSSSLIHLARESMERSWWIARSLPLDYKGQAPRERFQPLLKDKYLDAKKPGLAQPIE